MRSLFTILAVFIFIIGCNQPQLKGVDYYKTGTFKTVLKDKKSTFSIAERNDSIQVETYEGKKDTFLLNGKAILNIYCLKRIQRML